MKENLEQNTAEWFKIRNSHIGASDAPIILGLSPWKTPAQLWKEKLELVPCPPMNSSMQRGRDMEGTAKLAFENMMDIEVTPKVLFHPVIKYMMASLDGISSDGKIYVEIKCPNKKDHELAKNGMVPEKYMPQLQHQMEVCGLNSGYYFSFDGHQGVLVKVYRDQKMINLILSKEKEFHDCMIMFKEPK